MISINIISPLTCETNDFPEVKIRELCICSTSLVDQVNMILATDFIPKFGNLIENKEEKCEDLFDNYFKYDFVKKSEVIHSFANPLIFNKSRINRQVLSESDKINYHKLHNNSIKKSKSTAKKNKLNTKKEQLYLLNGKWKFHYPKKY